MQKPRVRVWLPVVQVMVAIALTTSNFMRPQGLSRPAWQAPDRQVCDALNAPASAVLSFIRKDANNFLFSHLWLEYALETVVYFMLVGLLWYCVGVEITSGVRYHTSVITPKLGTRTIGDLLLICLGVFLGVVGEALRQHGTIYWGLISIPYFVWGVVLVGFYGRDLWNDYRDRFR